MFRFDEARLFVGSSLGRERDSGEPDDEEEDPDQGGPNGERVQAFHGASESEGAPQEHPAAPPGSSDPLNRATQSPHQPERDHGHLRDEQPGHEGRQRDAKDDQRHDEARPSVIASRNMAPFQSAPARLGGRVGIMSLTERTIR